MILEKIDVETILPCNLHPERIKVIGKTSADLTELLPYLVTAFRKEGKSVVYNKAAGTITLKEDLHIITIHAKKFAITYLEDLDQGQEFFNRYGEFINQTHARKDSLEPTLESNKPLTALDIYNYLPQTNCRRCGQATCLAMAAKVAGQQTSIEKCGVLREDGFLEKRKELIELLESAGYIL